MFVGLPGQYHTEDVLVYSPADRTSNQTATCELKTMALVGMHFEHKTTKQPNWTWSTYEHRLNAPDCTALPAAGNEMGSSGPSQACPAAVAMDYNFYPKKCSVGDSPNACQTCNLGPASNAPPGECLNTVLNSPDDTGWCLDLGPAASKGLSKVCRQVPVKANYTTAHDLNSACALGLFHSVWGNYQLMSTQWYDAASSVCQNGKTFSERTLIEPQVDVSASADAGVNTRPFLGNTSMETYVRSDCTGCHSQAQVKSSKISTDGMWWLVLEAGDSASP